MHWITAYAQQRFIQIMYFQPTKQMRFLVISPIAKRISLIEHHAGIPEPSTTVILFYVCLARRFPQSHNKFYFL